MLLQAVKWILLCITAPADLVVVSISISVAAFLSAREFTVSGCIISLWAVCVVQACDLSKPAQAYVAENMIDRSSLTRWQARPFEQEVSWRRRVDAAATDMT